MFSYLFPAKFISYILTFTSDARSEMKSQTRPAESEVHFDAITAGTEPGSDCVLVVRLVGFSLYFFRELKVF